VLPARLCSGEICRTVVFFPLVFDKKYHEWIYHLGWEYLTINSICLLDTELFVTCFFLNVLEVYIFQMIYLFILSRLKNLWHEVVHSISLMSFIHSFIFMITRDQILVLPLAVRILLT
jgi:hypothetical protein